MPDCPPDLANKVLAADLRNLIKKVSDGCTLSPSEREMMDRYLAPESAPEDLHKARVASLLRKYCLGGKLTKEDLLEIAEYIPDPRISGGRVTRDTYRKALADYEPFYGVKPNEGRTIKRWIKRGRERTPTDLPPLDQPELMASWWSRNMKWKVPDRLLAFGKIATAEKGKEAASDQKQNRTADTATSSSDTPPPASNRIKPELPEGSGFAAILDRARQAERVAFSNWQAALNAEPFNAGDEELKQRAWSRAVETVRKLEKDAESILSRDLIAWPEAERIINETEAAIHQSLRSAIVRVATKIGIPSEWFAKINAAFQIELDHTFTRIAEAEYQHRDDLTLAAA
jgi:hypothetical protein